MNMQMTYFSYRTTGYKDLSNRITDDIKTCNNDGSGAKISLFMGYFTISTSCFEISFMS